MIHTIRHKDIIIDVVGVFTPETPNTNDTKGTPKRFDIETVIYKGIDVTGLVESLGFDFDDVGRIVVDKFY
jgi:hypothetical protein